MLLAVAAIATPLAILVLVLAWQRRFSRDPEHVAAQELAALRHSRLRELG